MNQSIEIELGMPTVTAEDVMPLPIEVRINGRNTWWKTEVTRESLATIMNSSSPFYDNQDIQEICLCTMEGEECSMRYIYSFMNKTWRFE